MTREKGVYAPLTSTKNFLVNDVLTSCFSVTENKDLQQGVYDVRFSWECLAKTNFRYLITLAE